VISQVRNDALADALGMARSRVSRLQASQEATSLRHSTAQVEYCAGVRRVCSATVCRPALMRMYIELELSPYWFEGQCLQFETSVIGVDAHTLWCQACLHYLQLHDLSPCWQCQLSAGGVAVLDALLNALLPSCGCGCVMQDVATLLGKAVPEVVRDAARLHEQVCSAETQVWCVLYASCVSMRTLQLRHAMTGITCLTNSLISRTVSRDGLCPPVCPPTCVPAGAAAAPRTR
jgi:hypothetical protein